VSAARSPDELPSAAARIEARPAAATARSPLRWLFRLRPEEVVALALLLPTTWLTLLAHDYAQRVGALGARYPGGVARVAAATLLLGGLWAARGRWPHAPWVQGLREIVPFLCCILIYTNLHDTIGFVNPHDVHHWLAALDGQIFGAQPCVWAERFITPARTEVMQLLYLNFFWIAPSTSLILLAQRRFAAFRAATVAVITCFYLGYVLYVAFPAAPPRLVLVYEFTKNLRGYPHGFSSLSASAFSLLPVDSRAAFPSLHAAISLVALVQSWRHLRWWFWVLVPCSIGLWASTIYLRHHYAVDLLAGWLLALFSVWAAPRVDAWWAKRQRALGLPVARGAPEAPPKAG
jgi:membrane-associated phospholipid phosphatase